MPGLRMCVDLGDDYVEIDSGVATLWQNTGPAVFTGTLDELDDAYPSVVQRLLDGKHIRRTN